MPTKNHSQNKYLLAKSTAGVAAISNATEVNDETRMFAQT